MGELATMDIETQCEAIQRSILAKFIKQKNQNKLYTDLTLWHLDQYRKAKEGVSIFEAYIANADRAPILPTYRTFLNSWSSFTGNEIPAQKTLAEICNELIFFNTKSGRINNSSMFLNKPARTKGLSITIKDL